MDSTTIPALQIYLKRLLETLPDAKMTLLTFQFPFTTEPYTWNGIEVIPLNGKNLHFKKLWTWRKALNSLKKIHDKSPITTIHSFWIGECSFIGGWFSKKYNITHVTTVMGQDARPKNKYVSLLTQRPTKFVTLSENHKATLHKNYNLDSIIIPWDLDPTSFPELQKSSIDILGVGSLNTIKNYPVFISTISELVKAYPNLKVQIIGEGIMRQKLKKQINALKLNDHIELLGQLPRTEVLQKMAQGYILLHTSTYESFGFVFLEALYAGMHIVSHNVGIAKTTSKWQVCESKDDIIKSCKSLLSKPREEKNRLRITDGEECITSYLKLYNA